VSHYQPFKALHVYGRECYGSVVIWQVAFMFLGTGTMVFCLKHVGITDSFRDTLKMSVKTPARMLTAKQNKPATQS
jgi:Na+/H+ antiporter NhaD/arsenite permease-like protein